MCAVCHGLDGIAQVPDAPHLAGESPVYLTSQLEAFRSGERQHEQMTIIAQGLSDEDIADLAGLVFQPEDHGRDAGLSIRRL